MPLWMASVADTNIIRKITDKDGVRQHLAERGFVVREQVTVVSELSPIAQDFDEPSVGFSQLAAFSFMLFNLLCAPCFAAMGAKK